MRIEVFTDLNNRGGYVIQVDGVILFEIATDAVMETFIKELLRAYRGGDTYQGACAWCGS